MNQIMGDARVVRIRDKKRLQQVNCLFSKCRFVFGIVFGKRHKRKRIKGGGFDIIGKSLMNPGHRRGVGWCQMDDDAIRIVVTSLSRPHRSGGDVIERAAILATGAQSTEIVTWIIAHDGKPEAAVAEATTRGLYGSRLSGSAQRPPLRYVLPAGTLA